MRCLQSCIVCGSRTQPQGRAAAVRRGVRIVDKDTSPNGGPQPERPGVTTRSGLSGLHWEPPSDGAPPEVAFLSSNLPAAYRTVRACAMGTFFIMSQMPTELYAVYDGYSSEREAAKLSWSSLTMRVTTALRGVAAALRSFDLVHVKLLDPVHLLHALMHNVYCEELPLVDM